MNNMQMKQAMEGEIIIPKKSRQPLQKSLNDSIEFTRNKPSTVMKGESKSTHQLIFEMNEFYFDMIDKLRELRGIQNAVYGADGEDSDSGESDALSLAAREKLDPKIKQELDKMAQLDKEIEETFKLWKIEKMDRHTVQNNLCDLIQNSDDYFGNKSEVFLNLCKLECNQKKTETLKTEYKDNNTTEIKKSPIKDQKENFIHKNIERVKNKTMASYSLTDEEKITLESLLSDIDNIDSKPEIQDISGDDNECIQDHFCTGAYGLDEDEKSTLGFLDAKLLELSDLESASASAISICKSNTDKIFEEIEQDEKDGKYWKHENRLKLIEQELELLKLKRNSDETECIKKEDNESNEDMDVIDFVEELEKRKQRLEDNSEESDYESDTTTEDDTNN